MLKKLRSYSLLFISFIISLVLITGNLSAVLDDDPLPSFQ
jgi:hypothetical protein